MIRIVKINPFNNSNKLAEGRNISFFQFCLAFIYGLVLLSIIIVTMCAAINMNMWLTLITKLYIVLLPPPPLAPSGISAFLLQIIYDIPIWKVNGNGYGTDL